MGGKKKQEELNKHEAREQETTLKAAGGHTTLYSLSMSGEVMIKWLPSHDLTFESGPLFPLIDSAM